MHSKHVFVHLISLCNKKNHSKPNNLDFIFDIFVRKKNIAVERRY